MNAAPKSREAAPCPRSEAFVQQTFEFEAAPESRPMDDACRTAGRRCPAPVCKTDPLVDPTERCAFWSIAADVKNARR